MRMMILFLLMSSVTALAAPTKIRVGTEWVLPYTGLTEKGQPTGYIYDILEDIGKKYNYKFEYVEIPALRQVPSLQKNEIDYAMLPVYVVRYQSNIDILSTAFGVTYAGALMTGKLSLESLYDLSDLAGKTILMSYMGPDTEDFRAAVEAEAKGKKTEIVEVGGTDIAKRMVLMMKSKRADIALGDYNVLRYTAMQSKGVPTHVIPASFAGFGAVVALTRKGKPGARTFERDIEEWFANARKSGRLNKILKRYNLTDWDNLLPY